MPFLYLLYSILSLSLFSSNWLCTAIQLSSKTSQDNETLICDPTFPEFEEPAAFTGGWEAWKKYLSDYTVYPDIANRNRTQGLIKVQFTISEKGDVTEVTPLNELKDSLTEAAVRVIQYSPKWKPAIQDGRPVKWRTVQQITFQIEDEDLPACDTVLKSIVPIS